MVQVGREPADFKPLPAVGSGAYEIRIRDAAGAFRVVYVAKFEKAVLQPCLACFSEENPKDVPGGHQAGSAALQINRRAVMKKKQARQVKGANNVFLDLGFPPHEAAVMLLRCELAEALRQWMDREAITQGGSRQAPWRGPAPYLRVSRAIRLTSCLWTHPRGPVCKGWRLESPRNWLA